MNNTELRMSQAVAEFADNTKLFRMLKRALLKVPGESPQTGWVGKGSAIYVMQTGTSVRSCISNEAIVHFLYKI